MFKLALCVINIYLLFSSKEEKKAKSFEVLRSAAKDFEGLRFEEEEEEENDLYQNRTDTNSVKESCTTFILKDLFLFALPFFLSFAALLRSEALRRKESPSKSFASKKRCEGKEEVEED